MTDKAKYFVLRCDSITDLVDITNKWISLGWIPQGGVSVSFDPHICSIVYYTQAMVKDMN